jgi:hypothetical protein
MAKKTTVTDNRKSRNSTRHKTKKTSIGMSHNSKTHTKGSKLYRKKYRGQGK